MRNDKGQVSAGSAPLPVTGSAATASSERQQPEERATRPPPLAAMGDDGGAAAWVEDTCSSLSTAELFVQPDMGDGRFAEASSVLRTLLGWSGLWLGLGLRLGLGLGLGLGS